MAGPGFPTPVQEVIETVAEVFLHQNKPEFVELLEKANAWFDMIEADNWNGGTYTWELRLEVPVSLFAAMEPRLKKIEKAITEKLTYLNRIHENDHIAGTTITPAPHGKMFTASRIVPSDADVRRLWPERRFRLFLSHVAKYKQDVSLLKDVLEDFGVAAFVAHEAISPSLEWQKEIELALRSMHALAALITADFHASSWTDQEIGWAFGRGLLVLPIRIDTIPYGFAGKVQAIRGDFEKPHILARSIVESLLTHPQTHGEMRRAIVPAFVEASSFAIARTLCGWIVKIKDFTDEEKAALRDACEANGQVRNAWDVPKAIYKSFGKPVKRVLRPKDGDEVRF